MEIGNKPVTRAAHHVPLDASRVIEKDNLSEERLGGSQKTGYSEQEKD